MWNQEIGDATGWLAPTQPRDGRRELIYPFPLGEFMAEVRIPVGLKKQEAERLCTFIKSLIVPEGEK